MTARRRTLVTNGDSCAPTLHLLLIPNFLSDIFINFRYSVNSLTPRAFSKFDLRDLLYIGGHPKAASLSEINSKSQRNFTGCLQQLYYNDVSKLSKYRHARQSDQPHLVLLLDGD